MKPTANANVDLERAIASTARDMSDYVRTLLKRIDRQPWTDDIAHASGNSAHSSDDGDHLLGLVELVELVFNEHSEDPPELTSMGRKFAADFIAMYIRAAHDSPEYSRALLGSLFYDMYGVEGSALLPKFVSFSEKATVFRKAVEFRDADTMWAAAKEVVKSGNEFIAGLLVFVLPIYSSKCDPQKVAKAQFGTKMSQFKAHVTLPYNMIECFVDTHLRNGIAHEEIFLDRERQVVEYRDAKQQFEKPLIEFVARAAFAAQICQGYTSAIAVILLCALEKGELLNAAVRETLTALWPHVGRYVPRDQPSNVGRLQ